jgi:hypothetical protein
MIKIIHAQGIKNMKCEEREDIKGKFYPGNIFYPFFRVGKNALESSSKQIKNHNICFHSVLSGCWGRDGATNRFNMHPTWHKSS